MLNQQITKSISGLVVTAIVCIGLGLAQTASASAIENTELKKDLFNLLIDIPERTLQMHPDDLPKQVSKYYLVVDVRSSEEFADNHIEGAINIPFDSTERNLEGKLPKDKNVDILLYSQDASQSIYALIYCQMSGYENVRYIEGGLAGWEAANRKIKQSNVDDVANVPERPGKPWIQIVKR